MYVEKISDLVDETDALVTPPKAPAVEIYGGSNPDLPDEVRTAYLRDYPMHQLEGRLVYYEREALFERNPVTRKQCKQEAQRTQTEINRRKMYLRKEADRIFKL